MNIHNAYHNSIFRSLYSWFTFNSSPREASWSLEYICDGRLSLQCLQPIQDNSFCLDIHWEDGYWSWSSNTLTTWCKEPTHWKRPWCWKSLRGGEEGDRGWDDGMTSPTPWTWVWANSRRQWKTGKTGMLTAHGAAKSCTQLSNWTTRIRD